MSALVTGASGGLGSAVALTLGGAGHDVGVHYRGDREGADATVAAIRGLGAQARAVYADLDLVEAGDLDRACADLVAATAELGPVRVAVLGAFPQHLVRWEDLDTAAWDAYHRAGLRPTTALLHAAAEAMEAGGVIVVIGSIEELRPAHHHAPYGVAKAALRHLVRAAAHELGPRGIRVVGVAPGLIERPGLERDWPDGVRRYRAAAALGRPVTAGEVADTVAFLASGRAGGITGTTVTVDAGWSAGPGW
jgi:3-oxoacyl-[acyl-carrier protein] reductase